MYVFWPQIIASFITNFYITLYIKDSHDLNNHFSYEFLIIRTQFRTQFCVGALCCFKEYTLKQTKNFVVLFCSFYKLGKSVGYKIYFSLKSYHYNIVNEKMDKKCRGFKQINFQICTVVITVLFACYVNQVMSSSLLEADTVATEDETVENVGIKVNMNCIFEKKGPM